jgi:ComF family protein
VPGRWSMIASSSSRPRRSWRSVRRALLDLLFPPRCAGCGRRGAWLCAACAAQLAPLAPPWCARCGIPLAGPGATLCPGCRVEGPFALDRARAAYAFREPIRAAIHRFKYEGERGRAAHLAALTVAAPGAADLHRAGPAGEALIVPVPLDSARRRARGYNQSEELAREFAELWGRPLATELARSRETRPQVGLDRLARRENVRGAFVWRGDPLVGCPVLLVDDVMTTGATAEECAAALKAAGARWVGVLTVARPVSLED